MTQPLDCTLSGFLTFFSASSFDFTVGSIRGLFYSARFVTYNFYTKLFI